MADIKNQTFLTANDKVMFQSCGAMNIVLMTALEGYKNKLDEKTVLEKVQPIEIDVEGTVLQGSASPQTLLVKKVYEAANGVNYDRAVEIAFGLVTSCVDAKK